MENDPFDNDPFGGNPAIITSEKNPRLGKVYNLDFEALTVDEIIRQITDVGDLQYRIDENAVVIGGEDVALKVDQQLTQEAIDEKK